MSTCPTQSEPFALQNLGDVMVPEFIDCCLLVIDPKIIEHHQAYVVIEYQNELYFRQYIEQDEKKYIRALNPIYTDIELVGEFIHKGCVTQQKQRGQHTKHYYQLNKATKKLEFVSSGYFKRKKHEQTT